MASSVVTGGVTISAATLAPLVSWGLAGFPPPVPDSVPFLIAAGIITAGHVVYNYFNPPTEPPKNQPPKGASP